MAINITATNVKLWKNEHATRNGGKFYTYSISINKKMQDGSYKNKGIKVMTSRENRIPDEIPSGSFCDIEGFMTLEIFQGRDGEVANPAIFANSIKFKDYEAQAAPPDSRYLDEIGDSFASMEEDIPF